LGSDAEYAEAFRQIFTEAVRCRVRSAFPVGSTLSGGLDSSSITCVARQLIRDATGSKLCTFSYVFDEVWQCDERPFINSVIAQGGLIPYFVSGDRVGPLTDWESIFWYTDETFLGPNTYLPWGFLRIASQKGMRILLDGFDGDTTVSHGIFYLNELAHQRQWPIFATNAALLSKHFGGSALELFAQHGVAYFEELTRQHRWFTFITDVQELKKHLPVSRKHLVLHHGIKPLVPTFIQQAYRKLREYNDRDRGTHATLNPDFAKRVGLEDRINSLAESWQHQPLTARQAHWYGLTSGLIPIPLEVMHRIAPAFSIEPRHPFMDKRLIEFCLALPPQQKLHEGWTRMVLRRSMQNILPPQVQWRGGKTSYGLKFLHGLLTIDQRLVDEVISHELSSIAAYTDINCLRHVYHRLLSSAIPTDDDAVVVWKAVALARWLRYTGLSPPGS
jgi:asparagine synthase (glutamine-hydrolysing)